MNLTYFNSVFLDVMHTNAHKYTHVKNLTFQTFLLSMLNFCILIINGVFADLYCHGCKTALYNIIVLLHTSGVCFSYNKLIFCC